MAQVGMAAPARQSLERRKRSLVPRKWLTNSNDQGSFKDTHYLLGLFPFSVFGHYFDEI